MATLDMQNTAQLAESRRKMQARRRMKNRIALTLSMATMAFGLFWLIWILMSTITRGIDGMSLALFTEMTPPPNTAGGGLANALAGSGLLILWATVLGTRWGLWPGSIWRNMAVNPGWRKSFVLLTTFCFPRRQLLWGCLFTPSWWRRCSTSPVGRGDCAGAVAGTDRYPYH